MASVDKTKKTLVRDSGSSLKETISGLSCGIMFGITSAIIGQPFDTIKTKMQAHSEYIESSMLKSFKEVYKQQGIKGLYRGIIPPLFGSSIFRAVQFSVYGGVYTFLGKIDEIGKNEINFTSGLQFRVIIAAIVASTARTFIETPLELIKVRKQLGQKWKIKELMNGFMVTWLRTLGLMVTFFILVDYSERKIPQVLDVPILGPFFKGGICATLAWWLIWPFETIKSQIQSTNVGPKTITKRLFWFVKKYGFFSLYRGILPGSLRSLIANGSSMAVFTVCQDFKN